MILTPPVGAACTFPRLSGAAWCGGATAHARLPFQHRLAEYDSIVRQLKITQYPLHQKRSGKSRLGYVSATCYCEAVAVAVAAQGRMRLDFPTDQCLEHRLPHIHQNGDHASVYQVHGKARLALRRGVETK
ncbi:uncharacterized protein M421DRAFT_159487 [Didymella exigua CBS 183.55]|uniref:Uncharacterized protein n=1 Tax=Didymella exigua CBS 183.55 TaxID=1150837 RepID=A0A6A5RKR0_9PLEO|nr:uncharacterized protein M421DRAFT_159487 [Didymella exigua CBS 183.55]KAF1928372.1 hypothetical protein M421DRAFT_159487 [Didymella exigua CBS 183.55]